MADALLGKRPFARRAVTPPTILRPQPRAACGGGAVPPRMAPQTGHLQGMAAARAWHSAWRAAGDEPPWGDFRDARAACQHMRPTPSVSPALPLPPDVAPLMHPDAVVALHPALLYFPCEGENGSGDRAAAAAAVRAAMAALDDATCGSVLAAAATLALHRVDAAPHAAYAPLGTWSHLLHAAAAVEVVRAVAACACNSGNEEGGDAMPLSRARALAALHDPDLAAHAVALTRPHYACRAPDPPLLRQQHPSQGWTAVPCDAPAARAVPLCIAAACRFDTRVATPVSFALALAQRLAPEHAAAAWPLLRHACLLALTRACRRGHWGGEWERACVHAACAPDAAMARGVAAVWHDVRGVAAKHATPGLRRALAQAARRLVYSGCGTNMGKCIEQGCAGTSCELFAGPHGVQDAAAADEG